VTLAQTQAELARLFTQRAARGASAGNLGDGVSAAEIERFARGLLAKRRLDVAKWLPQTAAALGPEFGARLGETLAEPPPGARADALALVARLRSEREPPWIGDLAAYEGEFLRAWGPKTHFAIRLYRWPAPRIAERLAAGDAVGEVRPARTLAVWARRRGGRLWRRWWTLGPA
jgi:hypothetical protein